MPDMLSTYEKMLRINKDRLDDELEIQSEIQQRIAMQVSELNTQMLDAKEGLKQVEADVTHRVRRASGDTRVTDKQVESEMLRSEDRIQAFQRYSRIREQHERWSSMLESWRQRGFSLKTLADLYTAQYFTIDTAYKKRVEEERRESMRQANERIDARRREEGERTVESRPSRRRVVED